MKKNRVTLELPVEVGEVLIHNKKTDDAHRWTVIEAPNDLGWVSVIRMRNGLGQIKRIQARGLSVNYDRLLPDGTITRNRPPKKPAVAETPILSFAELEPHAELARKVVARLGLKCEVSIEPDYLEVGHPALMIDAFAIYQSGDGSYVEGPNGVPLPDGWHVDVATHHPGSFNPRDGGTPPDCSIETLEAHDRIDQAIRSVVGMIVDDIAKGVIDDEALASDLAQDEVSY
jgi:hypothetical protein